MNIYEQFGRQAERLQELTEFGRQTMSLLADLQAGRVQLSQVELDDAGWNLRPVVPPSVSTNGVGAPSVSLGSPIA